MKNFKLVLAYSVEGLSIFLFLLGGLLMFVSGFNIGDTVGRVGPEWKVVFSSIFLFWVGNRWVRLLRKI